MGWPRFLVANGAGGIVWAIAYGSLGYFLGDQVHSVTGRFGIVLAVVADIGLVLFLRRNLGRLENEAVVALPGPLTREAPGLAPAAPSRPRLAPAFGKVAQLLAPARAALSEVASQRLLFERPLGVVLVMAQKTIWGVTLAALASLLLVLRAMQVTQPLQSLFRVELREDPHDLVATFLIGLLPSFSLGAELLLGLAALTYALIEAIQVWGLWRLHSAPKAVS
ncbi:MAG: DUF2127 domain-containing protein, partial [Chloroflexota bacterium]|nr:DUF2127 domain-containing protein [Chloroflexota bacterium]